MEKGDFIKLDFDAFVKESNQLVDTTHEDVAKEHDAFNERAKYAPISVVIGAGHVVKGLDDSLLTAEVGKETTVEVPPADAFGERDPKLVEVFQMNKILSLPEFRKGDKYPTEGMEVRMNNRLGIISRIFAGRVRVDFNNRYSGRTIIYKFTVKEKVEGKDGKLRAILETAHPSHEEFKFELRGEDEVDITVPDIVKLDASWAMAKFRLVSDLRSHLDMRTVRLIEEYVRKEKAEEEGEHDHEHDHDHAHEEEKKEE